MIKGLGGVQKFMGSKIALMALFVIGIYMAAAFLVGVGFMTEEATLERVSPNSVAGFFITQSVEKRLVDCEFHLNHVARALKQSDAKAALAEIQFAEWHIANRSVDALHHTVKESWRMYDAIIEMPQVTESKEATEQITALEQKVATLYAPITGFDAWVYGLRMLLGSDRQGRSILMRAIYSIKVAVFIGVVTALISVLFGSLLGAAAGYFGGVVDVAVIWLYSTFASIPNLVLLSVLAFMFTGTSFDGTLIPVYVAFCATFWIGPCRVIRGETLKLKELEYIHAAKAMGLRRRTILIKHVLPNTAHLMLIHFSLLFIGAIKSEVILTFLGLGVKKGASWGMMIKASGQEVVRGHFWQIGAATFFMFGLVLAFNIVSDALQDAFDPRHV